jgi:hypothetical protein
LTQINQNASKIYLAPHSILMHDSPMRTTVTLDDDVYQLASLYAAGRGITLGAALGELTRKGQTVAHSQSPSAKLKKASNGLLIFAPRNRTITSEMVKEAQEDALE